MTPNWQAITSNDASAKGQLHRVHFLENDRLGGVELLACNVQHGRVEITGEEAALR